MPVQLRYHQLITDKTNDLSSSVFTILISVTQTKITKKIIVVPTNFTENWQTVT